MTIYNIANRKDVDPDGLYDVVGCIFLPSRKSILLFRNPHSGLSENGVPFGRNMQCLAAFIIIWRFLLLYAISLIRTKWYG